MSASDAARAALVLLLCPVPGRAADAPASPDGLGPDTRRAVAAAVTTAQRRLREPRCQRVFGDFSDAAGVPLADKLKALGRTGDEHLAALAFADGSAHRACTISDVLAFTSPGSATVRVCSSRFAMWQRLHPQLVEAIVIHEALHTLGLGENPPTSATITRRVMKRCRP